jgi:hypothetical protein
MRRILRPARRLLTGALILAVSAGISGAAEMRKWTNLKGQTIEAKLLSVDAETVNLQLKNGSRASVPRTSLSAADQKYLTEYGGAKALVIDPDAKISVPEKDMRFDPKTLINRDDKLVLPGEFSLEFKMVESEHFIILTSGSVRGGDTAELAERLWYGMSFYHPGFKAKWGDAKRAIFLCGDKEDYLTLGEYNVRNLVLIGQGTSADNVKLTWPQSSGAGLRLGDDLCSEYKLDPNARAFDASDKTRFKRGVWNPFPTHCIAGDVLGEMMGGAGGGVGSDGYFAIARGHSYFKEIQLTDETVTTMINADAYAGDEITKAGGFDDGRKWARTLRDLVKKGKVTPKLDSLYAVKNAGDLNPELTVSMYGLSRYMQSTPSRMQNFSKFLDRVDTGRAIPQPIELAKIFGFDSVEAFEADWIAYLKGNDFK